MLSLYPCKLPSQTSCFFVPANYLGSNHITKSFNLINSSMEQPQQKHYLLRVIHPTHHYQLPYCYSLSNIKKPYGRVVIGSNLTPLVNMWSGFFFFFSFVLNCLCMDLPHCPRKQRGRLTCEDGSCVMIL